MKDKFNNLLIYFVAILVIASASVYLYPTASDFLRGDLETTTSEEAPKLRGVAFAPFTIIGVTPTSTSITVTNTEFYSTSTATTTDYFVLGAEIDKVDLFVHARSSSTGSSLNWDLAVNPNGGQRATSTLLFYSFHPGEETGGLITWNSASTTNAWALSGAGQWEATFPLCNNTYDGLDEIPTCNAGTYRLNFAGSNIQGGIEVFAEISAKSFTR